MKRLPLFYETCAVGERKRVKTLNLDVTEVNMVVNGIPNKVFSQGTKGRDLWKEVYRRIEKENSAQSRKHERQ